MSDIRQCAECGHLHWDADTREYVECPLRSEGCRCAGQNDVGEPLHVYEDRDPGLSWAQVQDACEKGWLDSIDRYHDARDATGCYCPSDCACHKPSRLTVCGCTGNHS